MSKIYDALRRAEEERRRRGEHAAPPQAMAAVPALSAETAETADDRLEPARRVVRTSGSSLEATIMDDLLGLRSALEAVLPGQRRRVIAFTSLGPGDGTTSLVTGFARLLATDPNTRTAVVDANLVTPGVARAFSIEPEPGLADLLTERSTPASALTAIDDHRLHVLPAGVFASRQHRPDQSAFERVLAGLRGYDYVLVDCAPVLTWSPSADLASATDGVILVVRWGRTKREVAARGMDLIAAKDGRVLGVILNRRRYPIPDVIYRRV